MVADGLEKVKIKPSNSHTLWCPFCDEWKRRDSMVSRKRLGMHIVDEHPEEIRFHKDSKPPALEDIK